jgi:hypothetical protein
MDSRLRGNDDGGHGVDGGGSSVRGARGGLLFSTPNLLRQVGASPNVALVDVNGEVVD